MRRFLATEILQTKIVPSTTEAVTLVDLVSGHKFKELAQFYLTHNTTDVHDQATEIAHIFLNSPEIVALPHLQKYKKLEKFLSKFRKTCAPFAAIVERHAREQLQYARFTQEHSLTDE